MSRRNSKQETQTIDTPAGDMPAGDGGNHDGPIEDVSVTDVKETKAAKFTRLARQRVPNALKRLSQVENLASRQSYEYTPEKAQKVIDAIDRAVKRIRDAFAGSATETVDFSLDD